MIARLRFWWHYRHTPKWIVPILEHARKAGPQGISPEQRRLLSRWSNHYP
jgi:hypothetical protein